MSKILNLPMREQKYDFDCSVATAWSILKYYKIKIDYNTLLKASKVCPVNGLQPLKLVNLLKKFGVESNLIEHKTIRFLKSQINKDKPIVILGQARKDYNKSWADTWSHGHYGVVFGYDDYRMFIYDPSIGGVRTLTNDQLNARWHDEWKNTKFLKSVITINHIT